MNVIIIISIFVVTNLGVGKIPSILYRNGQKLDGEAEGYKGIF